MLFVLTQTWPSALCQTRTLRGRSSASSGDAIMRVVPPFGLPKISTWASCIVRPMPLAKSLWSIWAKRVRFRLPITAFKCSNVASTANGLGLLSMPSTEGDVPEVVGSFMFFTFLLSYVRSAVPLCETALLLAWMTVSWISFSQSAVRKDRAQGIDDLGEGCSRRRGLRNRVEERE